MATLQAQTFDGLPGGMNVAQPAQSIDDTEVYYMQDALMDYPGLVRRRGPVSPAANFAALAEKASGIFGTISPAGNYRLGILTGDNVNGYLRLLSADFSAISGTYPWNGAMPATPPSNPYRAVDSKPALTGGCWIGSSQQYSASGPVQNLGIWRGGNNSDYTTGTITLTRGSAIVTGAGTLWATNASPGMFVFATVSDPSNTGSFTLTYVGVIKSIQSDTSLTLTVASPYTTAATGYKLTSVRGFQYRVLKGRITTTTSSATVTGAVTKFISQYMDVVVSSQSGTTHANTTLDGLSDTSVLKVGMRVTGTNIAAGTTITAITSGTAVTLSAAATGSATNTMTFKNGWNLYKAADLTWIGRVVTVNNDISITLAANAAVALTNEPFIALCGTGDWTLSTAANAYKVGFLNATYAGRQWYANNGSSTQYTSRVWFSDPSDPEGVDLSGYDGDFIDTASTVGVDTPIKALIPTQNALLVIKENETFAITGTSPSTFSLKKVEDDGAMSGMSAVAFGGGAIWAGRDGIHFFDGVSSNNLTQHKLGQYYKNAIATLDPTSYRMWGMIVRNHYFLSMEFFTPTIPVVKGSTSSTPSATTICINMETGSVSLMTNLLIRGFVQTPADTGRQVLYIINDNTKGNIASGFALFDDTGPDLVLCDLGAAAPFFPYGVATLGAATTFNGVANTKYFSSVAFSQRAAVKSIRVYTTGQGGGVATGNIRAGIYSDVAGVPTALLGSTNAITLTQTDGPSFRELSFATPLELAAGTYWIGVQVELSNIVAFYQGSTANAIQSASDTYADGLAAAFGAATNNNGPLVAYAFVSSVGPDFYIETKKFSEGDTMHKKMFKQLALTYLIQGDSLSLDTVPGLQNIGATAASTFPTTVYTWDTLSALIGSWDTLASDFPTWDSLTAANYKPARLKFIKRNQTMSFRIYQTSPAVTDLRIGPMQLAFKWQRLGRV